MARARWDRSCLPVPRRSSQEAVLRRLGPKKDPTSV